MPMMGFEPRTSGVGSDRSTNWATTTPMIWNFEREHIDVAYVSTKSWDFLTWSAFGDFARQEGARRDFGKEKFQLDRY